MKFKFLTIGLLICLTGVAGLAHARTRDEEPQSAEQKTAVSPTALISLCVLSGNITVQGWDRNEVLARSNEGEMIQLRREGDPSQPAAKVQVVVVDKDEDLPRQRVGCQTAGDVDLSVPRGATVHLQAREGSIHVDGVAILYAGTQNGDIDVQNISRGIEIGTISGNLSVSDSKGRMDLNSIGGSILVTNVEPADKEDLLEVTSVSGDIELDRASHANMNLRTVNGNMRMVGPLASGGQYGINTMSGDVTLALPANASFQLNAKISSGADIISDFPVKLMSEPQVVAGEPVEEETSEEPKTTVAVATPNAPPSTPEPPDTPEVIIVKPSVKVKIKPKMGAAAAAMAKFHSLRRLTAICGSGDATINLASFSGTLHLQKD